MRLEQFHLDWFQPVPSVSEGAASREGIMTEADEVYGRAQSVTDLLKVLQQLRGASKSKTRSCYGAQGWVQDLLTCQVHFLFLSRSS